MKVWVIRIVLSIGFAILGFVASLFVAPNMATKAIVNAERSWSGLDIKLATLTTGETLAYLEGGDSAGETLLLIHGFGANKDNFTRLARKLGGYRLILVDLAGFGESSKPQMADYSSGWQAYRLRLFMKQLGIQGVHLAGNSMGGHIALAYAHRYPDHVKSLYLLAPGGFWSIPSTPALQQFGSETGDNPLIIRQPKDYVALYHLTMAKPPFVPKSVLNVFAQESIAHAELHRRISQQIVGDSIEERAKQLAQYRIPTRIVWGDQDKLLDPSTAKHAQKLMPHAQTHIMQGVGHLPMVEAVDETGQDYREFLAGIQN